MTGCAVQKYGQITVERKTGNKEAFLYACCPKCGRSIAKAKRCDGMELDCPKCGSYIRVTVDQDAKVVVEVVKSNQGKTSA